jgi:hypothetical protein
MYPLFELFEQYENCIFVSSLIHVYDISINNDRNSNLELYGGAFFLKTRQGSTLPFFICTKIYIQVTKATGPKKREKIIGHYSKKY